MLKIIGACFVILSCTALGFEKSMYLTKRLWGLKELQKMTLLLRGEITYRKAALPEALFHTAGKLSEPFAEFLRRTSKRADDFDGTVFADIFAQEADEAFKNSALTRGDKEELKQLGQYLGYLDITMQENTIALYLQELEMKIQEIQTEVPVKKKLYQSMGVLGGIFLAITFL